jgi:hypothetical protein
VTDGPSRPGDLADGPGVECAVRLDQRSAFGLLSPRGTLRVVDGILSWQPDGWRVPVWHVPAREVVGGEAGALSAFELWLETSVTGTFAVAVEPPGGAWATGGGNVPDVRGQVALDGLVAALRRGGARILGEPRSLSSRPGHWDSGLSGPF